MTAVTARIRRPALWMVYPALGALVCLLYAFVPPVAGNGFVVPGVGLSCSVAIIWGTRRNKPDAAWAWYLFALGQFMFAMGEAIAHLHYLQFRGQLKRETGNDGVRAVGVVVPDEEIADSDLILPDVDASLDEVRALLSESDEGLIPN